jgi:pyruvate/2-oxoglutarate dehydrogenase complex dihydrolipoamide dehydrogenase (E3) component
MTDTHYDCLIIGSGQAGSPLAQAFGKAGKKTALIERDQVGGTCINYGCTPTKTMYASGRVADVVRRAAKYGIDTGPIKIDQARIRQRKRDMVEEYRSGSEGRITHAPNLDLIYGEASFSGPKTVQVKLRDGSTQTITADQIFINTGARPYRPKIDGLDTVQALDSTSIMELDTTPDHLIVLGGGYIGLEFTQMFRRFGSRVTVIQRGPRLLAREDDDVVEEVAKILREDGIELCFNAEAVRVAKNGRGVDLTVQLPDEERTISGSHLLLAVGRTPNSDSLNLGAVGVATDSAGFITVNERLETNIPGIWALGDAHGGPQFTHMSYDDFRIIRANLIEGGSVTTTNRLVPYVVFMDPQLGRVGLSEQEAKDKGFNYGVAKVPMTYSNRAYEMGETRGFMKAIVDKDTEKILGCTILGIEGGEIMGMIQIAMMGGLSYKALKEGIFSHPTLSEALNNLFIAYDNHQQG